MENTKEAMIAQGIKKRIDWIDVIKGIMIILVLLTHSNPPEIYSRFFAPFFMTMFFFVSGYTFSTKKSFGVFLIGKIKHLIIPLFFMGTIKMLVAVIAKKENLLDKVKGLLFQISGQNDDLWFIGCIFTVSMLFYFVVRLGEAVKGRFGLPIIIICSLVLSAGGWFSVLYLKAKWPWQFENALLMMIYMALGYTYKRYDGCLTKKSKTAAVILCISSALLYIVMFILFNGAADMHNGIYPNPAAFIVMSFVAMPWIIMLAKAIGKTNIPKKLLVLFGKNTLFLYAFENYVILGFFMVCDKLHIHEPYYIASILCVALTMAVLLPLAMLVNRYIPWMVGGRKDPDKKKEKKQIVS